MLAHTEQYNELINKYMVRHFVKPGITGWAQVTGFRGETSELWQRIDFLGSLMPNSNVLFS